MGKAALYAEGQAFKAADDAWRMRRRWTWGIILVALFAGLAAAGGLLDLKRPAV